MISAIEDAFASRISGVWTGDIAWDGRPYSPSPDTPYLAVGLVAHSRRTLGAGANAIREWSGAWQASVVMPASAGLRPARDAAWEIAGHYRRGTPFPSLTGLQITNADIRPAYADTDFVRIPVVVEWFMMEVG
ncbi:phage tail terminator-like protein [Falsiroseomonas sp. CW058]|uniref:phage tail terminator-like protein n=1 Tax=Falsiroseomonas sp. CW058 TaxID=3388664 RepID=UPI003D3112B4